MRFILLLFFIVFIIGVNCQFVPEISCTEIIKEFLTNKTIYDMSCEELKKDPKGLIRSLKICTKRDRFKDLAINIEKQIDNLIIECNKPKPKPKSPKECFACLRIGSGNEYVSGAQNGCDGTGYECDILGYNCNTCWTNNPNSMENWCRGNNFYDKDNNKDISYKVQRVGNFNCETKKCWPGSHCGW